MIIENKNFSKTLFKGLGSYEKYIFKNKIDKILKISFNKNIKLKKKFLKDPYSTVRKEINNPFPPELDDLCRLHYLIVSRKVNTILEFGVGKSTVIFNDGLILNRINYQQYVKNNLRIPNAFFCYS